MVPADTIREADLEILRGAGVVGEVAPDLLHDESNMTGAWCVEACRPATSAEAAGYVRSCASRGLGLTLSGGRTGVVGGALPDGGAVLSTSLLRGIGPVSRSTVEAGAGVTLGELRDFLQGSGTGLFFPPDPTEWSATLGGMAATDASGSDSLLYGSTRRWVEAVEVVFSSGDAAWIERGAFAFDEAGVCRHPLLGEIRLPPLPAVLPEKDAAGYRLRPGMDLLDLLLGSEGTMCLVTSLRLRLAPEPLHVIETVLFPDRGALWEAVDLVGSCGARVRALEVMDGECLDLMRRCRLQGSPLPPRGAGCAVMARFEADSEDGLDQLLAAVGECSSALGLPEDLEWAGIDEKGSSRTRDFRHALPEVVNMEISRRRGSLPGIHKLGSDGAVPPASAPVYHSRIRTLLDDGGFEGIVFGHAGQGHLHANILPGSEGEMVAAREAMLETARMAVEMGGTVSAEHGLGRLKGHLLGIMHGEGTIAGMRALRRAVDPVALFAPAIPWP